MADPETPDRDDGGAAAVPDPQPDPQPVPERRALIAGVAGLVAGALAKATPAEAQDTVAVFRNLINPVTGTTALLRTNLTAMPLFLAETRRGGAGLASVASITGTTITASALNQDVAVLAMGVGTPGVIARADFTNVTVTAAPYAFDAQVALTAPDQGPLPDAFGGQAKVNVWDLPQDVSFGTKVFGIQAWTGSPPESPATLPTTGPVGFRSTVEFPQADPLTVALTPTDAVQSPADRAKIASGTTSARSASRRGRPHGRRPGAGPGHHGWLHRRAGRGGDDGLQPDRADDDRGAERGCPGARAGLNGLAALFANLQGGTAMKVYGDVEVKGNLRVSARGDFGASPFHCGSGVMRARRGSGRDRRHASLGSIVLVTFTGDPGGGAVSYIEVHLGFMRIRLYPRLPPSAGFRYAVISS